MHTLKCALPRWRWRRRLSIAVALAGDPSIIFLDEPTTGLDPVTRRKLWDVISAACVGRCCIITTHSMEEADVLCQRIGIMCNGSLRCIGSSARLKTKFGSGFGISCQFDQLGGSDAVQERVDQFMSDVMPGATLQESFGGGRFLFNVSESKLMANSRLSSFLKKMSDDEMCKQLGILDWGISQGSLEDVFVSVVEKANIEG
eukprot:TRINITY_DN37_c0_g1_i3.p1 TRINITY_DN37_c0_g1~~TRINITY_DN37_c0_g1_i3.p1  ORF type:complete len:202 (+),score=21.18 TRINITY_DN37_c0_g1_i3:220-825(+)